MGLSRAPSIAIRKQLSKEGLKTCSIKVEGNRTVDDLTEQAVFTHAIDYPAHGQLRVSNELRKTGVFVSPSGEQLATTRPSQFKERLKNAGS
jgi:hypothetical protein